MDVCTRLRNLANYMERTKTNLYFRDNWQSLLARPETFNARHSRALLTLTPADLLSGDYAGLRRKFLSQRDYIVGFTSEIMAKDDAEFIGECLLPDYTGGERSAPSEFDDIFIQLPHEQINIPMLIPTMYYYKYLTDDTSSVMEASWVFAAPCYLYLPFKISEKEFYTLSELCMDAYMDDCLKRND